jgi:hypothetical protein
VAKRRGGIYEPETRLWLFLIPGVCMPTGLFMYGLTISKGMAWPINAVGAGFIGAAIGGCGDISLTYCQDCYQYVSKTPSSAIPNRPRHQSFLLFLPFILT